MNHTERATNYLLQSGYLDEISELLTNEDDRHYIARQVISLVETCTMMATGDCLYEQYGD